MWFLILSKGAVMAGSERRCHVETISLADPEMSAQSPSLAALVDEGWTPLAQFVGERAGVPQLIIVFAPPSISRKLQTKLKWLFVIASSIAVGAALTVALGV
jgi:hypothetical protein